MKQIVLTFAGDFKSMQTLGQAMYVSNLFHRTLHLIFLCLFVVAGSTAPSAAVWRTRYSYHSKFGVTAASKACDQTLLVAEANDRGCCPPSRLISRIRVHESMIVYTNVVAYKVFLCVCVCVSFAGQQHRTQCVLHMSSNWQQEFGGCKRRNGNPR